MTKRTEQMPKRFEWNGLSFEIELVEEELLDRWLFGTLRIEIDGYSLSVPDETTTLRDFLFGLDNYGHQLGRSCSARLFGLDTKTLARTLNDALYEGGHEKIALHEQWARFHFLPGLDVLDRWTTFLVERDGKGRLIVVDSRREVREFKFPAGVHTIVAEVIAFLEGELARFS